MNHKWNVDFLQNSPLGIQHIYFNKFSIKAPLKLIEELKKGSSICSASFLERVGKILLLVYNPSERGKGMNERRNSNECANNTVQIIKIKVNNNFTATIIKWKFTIWEEMDKFLNCKGKFLIYRWIWMRISLQKK